MQASFTLLQPFLCMDNHPSGSYMGVKLFVYGFLYRIPCYCFCRYFRQSCPIAPTEVWAYVCAAGEFATTFINESLLRDSLYSTFIILSLFIPLVFLFINMFQKLYFPRSYCLKTKKRYITNLNQSMLTNREREVFRQILQGYSNSEISSKIYISKAP